MLMFYHIKTLTLGRICAYNNLKQIKLCIVMTKELS